MNPIIYKVGLISFFADLSSELLYPITPLFLTSILGASMTSVGLIEGCAELTASLLKGWVGKQSDRIGKRKTFVWSGYLLSTLSRGLIGFAGSWVSVLIARSMDRVGKGLRTAPRDALIAESVPKEQLGFAFGVHRGMDTLGAVLGPLAAIVLLDHWGEGRLREFYFLSVIPGVFAVLLALKLPEVIRTSKKFLGESFDKSAPGLPKSFYGFLVAWGLFALGNSSDAFLILKTRQGGESLKSTVILYCLFNMVYAISSPFLGKLADRFGKKRMMQASLILFALVYFGFGFSVSAWFLFPAYGLFMGMSEGVGKALVAEHVPAGREKDLGATAQGIFGMVSGFSALLASIIAGVLWDHSGAQAPFIFGGIGAILSLIVFLMVE